jgi:hypothetical protein
LIIQGGGDICASLDVAGASFNIDECLEECTAFAGTLTADALDVCLVEGVATISATANNDAIVPSGFVAIYVLTRSTELIIEQVGLEPIFEVGAEDIFTIHTFVFDPSEIAPEDLLDLIVFGETTGADVLALIEATGICASLDVDGAKVDVATCGSDLVEAESALQLTAWPSPTNQFLNVEVRAVRDDRTEFTVMSMQGSVVIPTTVMPAGQRMVVDVQNLRPGQYMIRVVSGDKVATERFMRMD